MRRPAPSTVRWLILAALLVFWELFPRTGIIPDIGTVQYLTTSDARSTARRSGS